MRPWLSHAMRWLCRGPPLQPVGDPSLESVESESERFEGNMDLAPSDSGWVWVQPPRWARSVRSGPLRLWAHAVCTLREGHGGGQHRPRLRCSVDVGAVHSRLVTARSS